MATVERVRVRTEPSLTASQHRSTFGVADRVAGALMATHLELYDKLVEEAERRRRGQGSSSTPPYDHSRSARRNRPIILPSVRCHPFSSLPTIAMHLEPFTLLPLEGADFVAAATIHRRCAAKGLTASTVDGQIVTAAIRHECRLLSADDDFKRIARVSDMRLFEPK